jgi:hypothetical protein
MPQEQPTVQSTVPRDEAAPHSAGPPPADDAYDRFEDGDEWLDDPGELPPRPRRRLLGAGGNPIALTLLGVLLIACGFIGGVLVEKGETSSASSAGGAASGLASRFAALRGTGAGGSAGTTRSSSAAGAGSFFGANGAGRPTAGTVAYMDGSTLYVTNSEGNTIKVKTSPATSVSKTVTSTVRAIHPGETVTITGSTGSSGAVTAESIGVGAAGGGLAALFGGSKSSTESTHGSGGETPALFGG